jgi:hypothetical protein
MRKSFVVAALILGGIVPLTAQDVPKLNFNIGGGVSTPLNPTARYAGISGNFATGAGYNFDRHNSIIGEFMWSGLPPDINVIQFPNAPFGSVNLYTLTANYRHQFDRLGGSPFGAYFIAGGGWYYRHISVDRNFVVPPLTPCLPIYTWWGFACDGGGYVYTVTVATKGTSAGGLNGGVGFSVRMGDKGWKFYMEARYHYAFSPFVATTLIPVTLGVRYN